MKRNTLLMMMTFILIITGCASYTIVIVDSSGQPINDIDVELLNSEGESTVGVAKSKGDGKYEINKNDISSDSFFVSIKSDDYLPFERLLSIEAAPIRPLILEDIMTAIVGYVLSDTEDTSPVENCRVSTLPETVETTTDNAGKFVLKSEQFEEIEYTVFINKTDYMEGSTTFTPHDNEVDTLSQAIFLKPIKQEDIKIKGKGFTVPLGADE